jgi:hypothetical protein
MKKLLLLLVAVMMLAGCSAEVYQRKSLFASNSHVGYSWWGFRNTTSEHAKLSASENWWGKEIPYIPAK